MQHHCGINNDVTQHAGSKSQMLHMLTLATAADQCGRSSALNDLKVCLQHRTRMQCAVVSYAGINEHQHRTPPYMSPCFVAVACKVALPSRHIVATHRKSALSVDLPHRRFLGRLFLPLKVSRAPNPAPVDRGTKHSCTQGWAARPLFRTMDNVRFDVTVSAKTPVTDS